MGRIVFCEQENRTAHKINIQILELRVKMGAFSEDFGDMRM